MQETFALGYILRLSSCRFMEGFIIPFLPHLAVEGIKLSMALCSIRITGLHRYYGPLRHPAPVSPFPCPQLWDQSLLQEFLLGQIELLLLPSCPCYRVAANTPPVRSIPSASLRYSMLSLPIFEQLDRRFLTRFERGLLSFHLCCNASTRINPKLVRR
jgi:hypothetical protein